MKTCPACSLHNADDAGFCIRCGGSLANVTAPGDTSPLLAGAHLAAGFVVDGKYRIVRVLGEGGMGIVYLAQDIHTDTPVVVKSIRSELADAPEQRLRILAEGRALARIDHPNVVRLNAVVVERSALYLVMQYIEGETLAARIHRHVTSGTPILLPEALRIYRMIALGVAAAHREGVIHRDLKPENILVRARDGVVKVTDFGIAKWEEDAKAGRGLTRGIIGSIFYMAPEQVRGQRDLDKRVDVYALGILLFEILTGRVPFDAPTDFEVMRLHAEAPLPRVSLARPGLPPGLDDVLARACAKDRTMRFADPMELLGALDAVETPVVSPAPPRERRRTRLSPVVWAAIGAALLAIAFGVARPRRHARPAATPPGDPTTPTYRDAAPRSPLDDLVGRWKSDTGREYEAVRSGDALEFRIVRAIEFPRQGYLEGEPRFRLLAPAGPTAELAVEDDLRPTPPEGLDYDPSSYDSCRVVFTSTGDRALLARYVPESRMLTVSMVMLTTGPDKFQARGGRVLRCVGLDTAKAKPIESVLLRQDG